jgi:hypothetical protein
VNLALPLAHKPRSGPEPRLGVILPGGGQRGRNLGSWALVSGFRPPWASS